MASVISAGKARPAPAPSSTIAGQEVGDVVAADRRAGEQDEPGDEQPEARQQHGARAEAGDQPRGEAEREHADARRDTGRKAAPVCTAS